ncbi:MAG TPA: TolC family protein, partial [Saprospiraceae bacterium]|nr:TolC family protein [Saprospiraceae bacterium]
NAAKLRSLTYRGLALQKEAEQSKALLQSQLLNEKRTYQRNLERLEFFTKTALPNADTMINTATSSFRHGEIGYIEYLQALQSAAEVKLDYLDTIRQLNQNILNINYLLNQ